MVSPIIKTFNEATYCHNGLGHTERCCGFRGLAHGFVAYAEGIFLVREEKTIHEEKSSLRFNRCAP